MFFQLKEGFVVPAEVEVRRICTPEMACQHSAMLAAQARLETMGIDWPWLAN